MTTTVRYPGGKAGAGVYQTIINNLPAHTHYIEAFLGAGAIMRAKRPAPGDNIGIDLSGYALARCKDLEAAGATLYQGSCFEILPTLPAIDDPETLIYFDPPYLMDSRQSQAPLYDFELGTQAEHETLLDLAQGLRCMVAISSYQNDLYDYMLVAGLGWRMITYQAMTSAGRQVTEALYMSYPQPEKLHDYSYLGANRTQRQQHKRKVARWLGRLEKMAPLERAALLDAIAAYETLPAE